LYKSSSKVTFCVQIQLGVSWAHFTCNAHVDISRLFGVDSQV